MQTIGTELDARMVKVLRQKMAARMAAKHIRMHPHHHGATGVLLQSSLQHLAKA